MLTSTKALLTNGTNILFQFIFLGIILINEESQLEQEAYNSIIVTMVFGHLFFMDGVLQKNIYQISFYTVLLIFLYVLTVLRGIPLNFGFTYTFLKILWFVILLVNLVVNIFFFRLLLYEFTRSLYEKVGLSPRINGK